MQVFALFVQICVLSFGISMLSSAARQSDSREPPADDWPQLMPVPEGKTAVAVVDVGAAVVDAIQPGIGLQFGSVEP